MVLLRSSLVEHDLEARLGVALVGAIHEESAILLGVGLGAELTGLRSGEPVVHRVGVVIIVGIECTKHSAFASQS